MKTKTSISFFGGTDTVTGSNFLVEFEGKKILIDCGLFQGFKFASEENRQDFPFDASDIDYLLVTHAHMDHIGRIPKLVKDGFKGKIYSTKATRDIALPMFEDALNLMREEERRKDLPPIYGPEDVRGALRLWDELKYGEGLNLDKLNVTFFPSGHILGSAMIELRHEGTLLFTGDLGNKNNLLIDEAKIPESVDYLVCESVYGDRNHEDKDLRRQKLVNAIKKATSKKGTLIIPAFSLERTQHILFEINNMVESGEIDAIPLFLDSPLAIKLTEIYRQSGDLFKPSVQEQIKKGDDIFDFPKLNITMGREDSMAIWNKPEPKIILAGSGMSMGGRVLAHEKKYLSDKKTTILFVGYQAAGSIGRRISEGEKTIDISGEKIKVRAEVMNVEGYSSHRDSDGLVDFVGKISPKKVFVVMGEPKTATYLAQRIREELGISAEVPDKGHIAHIDI